MSEKRKPASDTESGGVVEKVARGAVAEVAGGVAGKIYWLLAGFLLAFAGMFLLIGWQFGPLVLVEAQQYKKFTSHVDARIVESWLALEFDAGSVRNPEFWRASTNASPCIVAEYDGDWGAPNAPRILRHARPAQRFVHAGRPARHLARRALRVDEGRARLRRAGNADGARDQAVADRKRP